MTTFYLYLLLQTAVPKVDLPLALIQKCIFLKKNWREEWGHDSVMVLLVLYLFAVFFKSIKNSIFCPQWANLFAFLIFMLFAEYAEISLIKLFAYQYLFDLCFFYLYCKQELGYFKRQKKTIWAFCWTKYLFYYILKDAATIQCFLIYNGKNSCSLFGSFTWMQLWPWHARVFITSVSAICFTLSILMLLLFFW